MSTIFDMCDLDGNGRLSRTELNLYELVTSNEEVNDEVWRFVAETIKLEKNEITRDGFIQLNLFEAEQRDVDVESIKSRLRNLGFNQSLTIDQACPYIINISAESDCIELLAGEIYNTKQSEKLLTQLIEAKGVDRAVRDNLIAFEYHNNYWSAVEVRNESSNDWKRSDKRRKNENDNNV